MKTTIESKSHMTQMTLLLMMIILFLPLSELFAQVINQGSNLNGITVFLKFVWTWTQVVFGVLIVILVISTGLQIAANGGEMRGTQGKIVAVIVCMIIWAATPLVAGMFGITIV